MTEHFPKISIVTPSYNDSKYLERTILSVLDQGYPNLEYILIDGGSTDGSLDVIKKYENKLSYWVSEKDQGMYFAIQKGFERTSGEIMMWINSDDMLHPKSLFTIGQIFRDYPEINWLQGYPNIVDEDNRIVHLSSVFEVDKFFFYQKKHIHHRKYIQQESTSWRRRLWEKAGGFVSTEFKLAGDFDLWIRFFQHARLYNISALTGAFRLSVAGQASMEQYQNYLKETFQILAKYPLEFKDARKLKYLEYWNKIEQRFIKWNEKVKRKFANESVVNNKFYFDHASQSFKMH